MRKKNPTMKTMRKTTMKKNNDKKPRFRSHGWFMCVESSGIIKCALQQKTPENNRIVLRAVAKARSFNKNIKIVVYDRACKIKFPAGIKSSVDKFHGRRHTANCKKNPWVSPPLWTLVHGINTSIAESVFSYFRSFAKIINPMRDCRSRLYLLWLCLKHNEKVAKKNFDHLNLHQNHQKKGAVSYDC